MIDGHAHDRQAGGDIHAGVPVHRFERRVPLIVIARHHQLEFTAHCGRHERISRQRPHGIDTLGLGRAQGGLNHVSILVAEQPALTGMRIQAGHADTLPGPA